MSGAPAFSVPQLGKLDGSARCHEGLRGCARRGQSRWGGSQARQVAGCRKPRDRLPRGARGRRTAAPNDALDQVERSRRALRRSMPPHADRSEGGRHDGRGREVGAARHAHGDGAGRRWRGHRASPPRRVHRRVPGRLGPSVSPGPASKPDRRGHRRRAAHRPPRRLEPRGGRRRPSAARAGSVASVSRTASAHSRAGRSRTAPDYRHYSLRHRFVELPAVAGLGGASIGSSSTAFAVPSLSRSKGAA